MLSAKTLRSTVRELPNQLAEIGFLLGPLIRRVGMVFSGDLSKMSLLLAFLFKTGARAAFLAGLFLIVTLLHQRGHLLAGEYPFGSVLWALRSNGFLRSLWKKFSEKEPRIPFTSARVS